MKLTTKIQILCDIAKERKQSPVATCNEVNDKLRKVRGRSRAEVKRNIEREFGYEN